MTFVEPSSAAGSGLSEPVGWTDPLTGLEGPEFWHRLVIAESAMLKTGQTRKSRKSMTSP